MIKVSVITPSFNQGAFILDTIHSVCAQNCDSLEHIIMDGGSTDNTLEVLRENEHLGYKWFSQPDGGQSCAINKGIAMAQGQIIGWLNSDDCYLPGFFSSALSVFDSDPSVAVVYGDYVKIDETGSVTALRRQPRFDDKVCLHAYLTIPSQAALIRKSSLEQTGGLVREDLHYAMDHELFLRLSQVGKTVHIRQYFGAFRLHSASKSISQSEHFGVEGAKIRHQYSGVSNPMALKLLSAAYKAKTCCLFALDGCIMSRFGKESLEPEYQTMLESHVPIQKLWASQGYGPEMAAIRH